MLFCLLYNFHAQSGVQRMSVVQVLIDPPAVNSTLSISPLDPRRRVTKVKQEQNDELHAMHDGIEAEFQVTPFAEIPDY